MAGGVSLSNRSPSSTFPLSDEIINKNQYSKTETVTFLEALRTCSNRLIAWKSAALIKRITIYNFFRKFYAQIRTSSPRTRSLTTDTRVVAIARNRIMATFTSLIKTMRFQVRQVSRHDNTSDAENSPSSSARKVKPLPRRLASLRERLLSEQSQKTTPTARGANGLNALTDESPICTPLDVGLPSPDVERKHARDANYTTGQPSMEHGDKGAASITMDELVVAFESLNFKDGGINSTPGDKIPEPQLTRASEQQATLGANGGIASTRIKESTRPTFGRIEYDANSRESKTKTCKCRKARPFRKRPSTRLVLVPLHWRKDLRTDVKDHQDAVSAREQVPTAEVEDSITLSGVYTLSEEAYPPANSIALSKITTLIDEQPIVLTETANFTIRTSNMLAAPGTLLRLFLPIPDFQTSALQSFWALITLLICCRLGISTPLPFDFLQLNIAYWLQLQITILLILLGRVGTW